MREYLLNVPGHLRNVAEAFSRAGQPDRARQAHALACEVERELRVAERIHSRGFECLSCAPTTWLGDAPRPECEAPHDHSREDGSPYTPPPPPVLWRAAVTFSAHHAGLPSFAGCESDVARKVLVAVTRGPVLGDELPSRWEGYPVERRPLDAPRGAGEVSR